MASRHTGQRNYERVTEDRNREELIFAVLSLPPECDSRVKGLVDAINGLPDVYTCSSCGGHPEEDGRENPAPEGCFYVQFIVEPTENGFLSLGIIDLAARTVDHELLAVKTLNTTDSPRLVIFHILGRDGVDPDAVAKKIRSLCKDWNVSLRGVREYKRTGRRQDALERIRGFCREGDSRR
jgi:hypothetical protein